MGASGTEKVSVTAKLPRGAFPSLSEIVLPGSNLGVVLQRMSYSPSMGKLLLETVIVAELPTQPEFGVKLTPGHPAGPQPPAMTEVGVIEAASNDTKAAKINNFVFLIACL
jgi:hypothetical protein